MRAFLVVGCLVLFAGRESSAAVIVLDDVERGEFISTGSNFSGTDFMVIGESVTHSVPEYRSFLTFDLSGLTGSVVSASLSLQIDNYNATSSFDFSVFDFTFGNDASLGSSMVSVGVFNDLGTGVKYGSASVNGTTNPIGSTFLITLNAAAIGDINAKFGQLFTVGFADDAITGGNDSNIRLDRDPSLRVNQLIIETRAISAVPEPTSLALAGFAGIGMAVGAWRRRRQQAA